MKKHARDYIIITETEGFAVKYNAIITLKNGKKCIIRNAGESDGEAALENFILTHGQTDYLLTYPDENAFTSAQEAEYLKQKSESEREIELAAEVGGKIVGLAGIDAVGKTEKVKRRAEFGVSIDKDFWGIGIGRAMTRACIDCAKRAGYAQIELSVVAENKAAVSLYKSEGFVEYGRNPRGFYSRISGWQELILMRLELC